jgi:hypothetical protein
VELVETDGANVVDILAHLRHEGLRRRKLLGLADLREEVEGKIQTIEVA